MSFSVVVVTSLLASANPTAAIARDPATAGELQRACAARFTCASPEHVREAVQDAATLDIRCADDDAACWQRFAAAEGFARIIVGSPAAPDTVVWLHEPGQAARSGRGATATAALDAILAPPATPPAPVAPEAAPPEPTAPPAASAQSSAASAFAIGAAVSAGAALLAGAGATFVSVDLARSLDDAAAREQPLRDYEARNALFFSLAAVSGVTAVAAGGLVAAALLAED